MIQPSLGEKLRSIVLFLWRWLGLWIYFFRMTQKSATDTSAEAIDKPVSPEAASVPEKSAEAPPDSVSSAEKPTEEGPLDTASAPAISAETKETEEKKAQSESAIVDAKMDTTEQQEIQQRLEKEDDKGETPVAVEAVEIALESIPQETAPVNLLESVDTDDTQAEEIAETKQPEVNATEAAPAEVTEEFIETATTSATETVPEQTLSEEQPQKPTEQDVEPVIEQANSIEQCTEPAIETALVQTVSEKQPDKPTEQKVEPVTEPSKSIEQCTEPATETVPGQTVSEEQPDKPTEEEVDSVTEPSKSIEQCTEPTQSLTEAEAQDNVDDQEKTEATDTCSQETPETVEETSSTPVNKEHVSEQVPETTETTTISSDGVPTEQLPHTENESLTDVSKPSDSVPVSNTQPTEEVSGEPNDQVGDVSKDEDFDEPKEELAVEKQEVEQQDVVEQDKVLGSENMEVTENPPSDVLQSDAPLSDEKNAPDADAISENVNNEIDNTSQVESNEQSPKVEEKKDQEQVMTETGNVSEEPEPAVTLKTESTEADTVANTDVELVTDNVLEQGNVETAHNDELSSVPQAADDKKTDSTIESKNTDESETGTQNQSDDIQESAQKAEPLPDSENVISEIPNESTDASDIGTDTVEKTETEQLQDQAYEHKTESNELQHETEEQKDKEELNTETCAESKTETVKEEENSQNQINEAEQLSAEQTPTEAPKSNSIVDEPTAVDKNDTEPEIVHDEEPEAKVSEAPVVVEDTKEENVSPVQPDTAEEQPISNNDTKTDEEKTDMSETKDALADEKTKSSDQQNEQSTAENKVVEGEESKSTIPPNEADEKTVSLVPENNAEVVDTPPAQEHQNSEEQQSLSEEQRKPVVVKQSIVPETNGHGIENDATTDENVAN